MRRHLCFFFLPILGLATAHRTWAQDTLAGTQPLNLQADITSQLVDGVDKFLLREIKRSAATRDKFWNRDVSSVENYEKSVSHNRARSGRVRAVVVGRRRSWEE